MTRDEVVKLLQLAIAYDNRTITDATVFVWRDAATRGRWTFDEAVEALHAHYAGSTTFLMPAHIGDRIRAARNDRADREALEAIRNAPAPDTVGQGRLQQLIGDAFALPPSGPADGLNAVAEGGTSGAEARGLLRAAKAAPCPFDGCRAEPYVPCTRLGLAGRRTPLRGGKLHPSRVEHVFAIDKLKRDGIDMDLTDRQLADIVKALYDPNGTKSDIWEELRIAPMKPLTDGEKKLLRRIYDGLVPLVEVDQPKKAANA